MKTNSSFKKKRIFITKWASSAHSDCLKYVRYTCIYDVPLVLFPWFWENKWIKLNWKLRPIRNHLSTIYITWPSTCCQSLSILIDPATSDSIRTSTCRPVTPSTSTCRPMTSLTLTCQPVTPLTLTCRPVTPLTSTCRPVTPLTLTSRPVTQLIFLSVKQSVLLWQNCMPTGYFIDSLSVDKSDYLTIDLSTSQSNDPSLFESVTLLSTSLPIYIISHRF